MIKMQEITLFGSNTGIYVQLGNEGTLILLYENGHEKKYPWKDQRSRCMIVSNLCSFAQCIADRRKTWTIINVIVITIPIPQ